MIAPSCMIANGCLITGGWEDRRVDPRDARLLWHLFEPVHAVTYFAPPARQDPLRRFWQATTVLREHRGDGHVAALVTAGVSPVESHLLKVAAGESPEEQLRLGRAWSEEQWADGARALAARGWTAGASDGSIVLTDAGRAAR